MFLRNRMSLRTRVFVAGSAVLLLASVAGMSATVASAGPAGPKTTVGDVIWGSSGNIPLLGVGPGNCEFVGVGAALDQDGAESCTGANPSAQTPYVPTQIPMATSGVIVRLHVMVTESPATGQQNVYTLRLDNGLTNNGTFVNGGMTTVRCTVLPGNNSCDSGQVNLPFKQFNTPTSNANEGLVDLLVSRGCSATCPNGSSPSGVVTWSVQYNHGKGSD